MSIAYNDTSTVFAYSGAWAATSWSAAPQSGSVHMTSDPTASLSFTFPVVAIAFSVYGIRQPSGGLYNICIDCAPGAPYDSLVDGIAAPGVGPTPPGVLYQQTFSTPGIHTVVLRVQPDGRGSPSGNSTLAFTGFVLSTSFIDSTSSGTPAAQPTVSAARSLASAEVASPLVAETSARSSVAPSPITRSSSRTTLLTRTTASTTGTTTATTTSTTTAATTSTTAPALAPTTPAALTSTPIPAPPHTGEIIAAALGAVALLCIFTILVCWRRRRPRLRATPYSSRWGSGAASLWLGGPSGAGNGATSTLSETSGKGKVMNGGPVFRAVDDDAPPPPPDYGTRAR